MQLSFYRNIAAWIAPKTVGRVYAKSSPANVDPMPSSTPGDGSFPEGIFGRIVRLTATAHLSLNFISHISVLGVLRQAAD